jgi:hypothetical protein
MVEGAATGADLWVRKYRGTDGATLWTKAYHQGAVDVGWGVSIGPDDNPVVVGVVGAAASSSAFIRKYNGANGSAIWTKKYSPGVNNDAASVSCDMNGDAVVTGSFDGDMWVRKYRGSDGAGLWTKTFDGGKGPDRAAGVACDFEGNAVVAGQIAAAGWTSKVWVRKYRGYDGSTLWTKTFSAGFGTNQGRDVAVGPDGNPVVTARVSNGTNDTAWTRKYNGAEGEELWTTTYDPGLHAYAESVACDLEGNVFLAGLKATNNTDIWVRKYPPYETSPAANVYLAEGSTAWGFDTYITIENPNPVEVHADVNYMTSGGPTWGGRLPLPAESQTTIRPSDVVGAADFSTHVECVEGYPIGVDRTMTWEGAGGQEAHNSVGVGSPGVRWYLPEGSSAWGFECWLLIQNPNPTEADVTLTYMIEDEIAQYVNKTVPPRSRRTFNMADGIGAKDASVMVESTIPVIPERAMYRNGRRGGHDSVGTTEAAHEFYLAEGTTDWGFTTYVLIQNPNPDPAEVIVTYMTDKGPISREPFNMPANSRETIRVNDILPGEDFSTLVEGSLPIIAERAMYWNNGTGEAFHDSIGLSAPHTRFFLPDGETSGGRETWTLVQNPNPVPVLVEISYLTPTGEGDQVFTAEVPAASRSTFNMSEKIAGSRAGVEVVCLTPNRKIMVERAMYWNARGTGTGTIGAFSD